MNIQSLAKLMKQSSIQTAEHLELPDLPLSDIKKLDELFSCLKENNGKFVDLYQVANERWGRNRLLYFFFAEYLKKNSFTIVEGVAKDQQYVWKQAIAPRGMAFESFKKEYKDWKKI